MAPRRASPLDVPPAVSSSDEEEETSSEEGETSEDEQVQATPKPTVLSPNTKKTDDDSESDAESSSESEPADSTVKPIASKPMEEKTGARSKPSVAATPEKESAAKRPRESETTAKDSKKRVKKKSGPEVPPHEADGDGGAASDEEQEESKKSGGDDSKKLFQRLWSEEDEIVILKGLIDYAAKGGGDPAATFHDFIKKSLHVEVTKAQFSDKVRKLKKKYSNNAARKKYNPTKPHEQNVFELSKKIWGGGGSRAGVSSPKSNGAAKSNGKATLASPAAPKEGSRKSEIGGKSSVSVRSIEMIRFGMRSLPEEVVMKGLDLLPDAKKAELDAMWKKLHIDELELFVEKNQLMNEQVKLVLQKLRSSDH
ncbi:hypothetical protein L484_019358 [Morus notabilis]|uniref:Glabrous enhancer-binding protein-like DBD domain-containing protein n=1 Tax=Morus notabilis TaxID=981085 RepID=W9S7U1_9ROSA|nr:probable transcription factor At1g61730 [Morus notabilis]XP_024029338.1 probable transcription factor At1g61730 [Morus notabilis]XP_024029339.1 probable transcription factor At1g61730 [Morus notabilis]XP_024029340.1 probable transcription factor At1g61730 [Morus notabilis]XP_024029341.1 probable transcription factor At1g61730 [Morus notabilis]EXC19612.1 hypothetical protein L484_019358 [Morus notabilis]